MSAKEQAERAIAAFEQLNTCEYRDCFITDVTELFEKGWERQDVMSYIRTFEEVNPNLEEDVALGRRQRLYAKYIHLYVDELRDYNFQSLAPLL